MIPQSRGNHGPAERFGLVARFGRAHADEHGQAAGQQDERHHRDIGDAVKRPWPIGSGVADKSVGDKTSGKSGGVGDDEQPHRHFFGGNRECWCGHYRRLSATLAR